MEGLNRAMSGALRGAPAKGGGAYLLANSAVGGNAPPNKMHCLINIILTDYVFIKIHYKKPIHK